jgi:DNA polymerase-1
MTNKKRLLVIDALNMYFRAYIVNPSLSTNGQPIGGVKGFLGILQKLTRETKPDQIIICWDGEGGSTKRKSKDKNYKGGRKPIRLNRDIRNMSENEEITNKIWQQTRLVEMLNNLSVIQLMLPQVEADDIIGYVCGLAEYKDWQKVIVSSDKDFIQLCDEDTVLFRPIQKQVLNSKRVVETYGVHPQNFASARAICGDKSDNLPGVRGIGLPTVAKRLPFLSEERFYTIDEVVEFCDNSESDAKAYKLIIENRELIEHNYKLMQLYAPFISVQGKKKLQYAVENFVFEANFTEVKKMMIEDGFGTVDFSELFTTIKRIVADNNIKD